MLLLINPLEKGFVRAHTRKGKTVGPYFTKRPPGKVQEKHLKERFYDHDKASAKKLHEELEAKKQKHQVILEAAQKHHDELKKQGPPEKEEVISHKVKLSHLQAEIKNQQTNIDNHSRKQSHIKDRYQISSKQIVRKKTKADLEKRITGHTDEQKKTVRDIHEAHRSGKSKLEPGKVLKGKDKDHIYLETKHKDTGKTHHIAIHKDGSVKDPQVLHGGKFDPKNLKEHREDKKVVVKKPAEKPITVSKKEKGKEFEIPKPKDEPRKVVVKKEKELPKSAAEEHKNRSDAMMGNKNAWKGGPEEEGKKVVVKQQEIKTTDQKNIEDWNKNGVKSKAFKSWFGDSKVTDDKGNPKETHHMSKTIGNDGKPIVLYHGTRVGGWDKFDRDKIGETNLFGSGFYFTEDKGIAESYTEKGEAKTAKKSEIKEVYLNIRNPYRMEESVPDGEIKKIIDSAKKSPFKWEYIFDYLDNDQLNSLIEEGNKKGAFKEKIGKGDVGKLYLDNAMPVTSENVKLLWDHLKNSKKFRHYKSEDNKLNRQTLHNILSDGNKNNASKEQFNQYMKDQGHDGISHMGGYNVGKKDHKVWIAFEPNQIKATTNQGTFDPKTDNIYENGSEKTEAEKTRTRSQAMIGNKNAEKPGGPKEEPKKGKRIDIAAYIHTKKQLKKVQDEARTGKETTVITARSRDKHKVRYKVIEADDKRLIASNDIEGKINKDYPQLDVKGALQMRDRSSIQSKAQVAQMSNTLEPMFLTDSKIASDGAPIVGSDYKGKEGHSVVESGNGRVMAIRTAYKNNKASHYKDHLIEEADSFGIDPGTIKAMKNPILIRERVDKMTDEGKAKFAKESNKASVSQMTATEQAIEDSNYLGQLTNLKATESGRITAKNNKHFVTDFFSLVMDNDPREVGKLLNKDGILNDEGERRLTNAVFVRVYGANSDIMNKLIMKDTDKTRKITAGMLAAAPRMAKFKEIIRINDRHDLDISGNFIDALTAMEELKSQGVSLEEKLQTVDWSELGVKDEYKDPLQNKDVLDILKMIKEYGTGLTGSANKIASLLTNYVDEAEKSIYAEDPDKLTIEDAMGIAREKQAKTTKGEILKRAKDEVAFIQADRKGKKESYEKYLEEYPTGKFAPVAKEKLSKIDKTFEPVAGQGSF